VAAAPEVVADKKITRELEQTFGATWRAHEGPALIPSFIAALLGYWKGQSISAYDSFYDSWMDVLEAHPEALDRAVALLGGFNKDEGRQYLDDLDLRFREALPRALAAGVAAGCPRPKALGRARDGWSNRDTLKWVSRSDRRARHLPALLAVLHCPDASLWPDATRALERAGEEARPALLEALGSPSLAVRTQAAELLAASSDPALEAPLAAALAAAEDEGEIRVLERALAACRASTLDPDSFPETEEGDRALDAAMAALPVPPGAPEEPPRLRWRWGGELSEGARRWFLGSLKQESLEVRCEALGPVRERLDDEDCAALVAAATRGKRGDDAFTGGLLFTRALLGGEAELKAVVKRGGSASANRRLDLTDLSVEALVRVGSDAAVRQLQAAWQDGRSPQLRWRAGEALRRMAAARDESVEELLDSAVSHFGFSRRGEREFAWGDQTLYLRLDAVNALTVLGPDRKRMDRLPYSSRFDPEHVRAARKELDELRVELERLQITLARRLEQALISQRRWSGATWRRRLLRHPLTLAFSRALIWERLDADGEVVRFAVTDDAELVDLEWEEVELPASGTVRLAHPLRLSEEEREAWKLLLYDQEALQPFPQLERRTFAYKPREADKPWRWTWTGEPLSGKPKIGSKVYKEAHNMGDHDFSADFLAGSRGEIPLVEVRALKILSGGREIALSAADPLVFSEVIYKLHRLAGVEV
jgi:hypothetical protein